MFRFKFFFKGISFHRIQFMFCFLKPVLEAKDKAQEFHWLNVTCRTIPVYASYFMSHENFVFTGCNFRATNKHVYSANKHQNEAIKNNSTKRAQKHYNRQSEIKDIKRERSKRYIETSSLIHTRPTAACKVSSYTIDSSTITMKYSYTFSHIIRGHQVYIKQIRHNTISTIGNHRQASYKI